MALLKGPETSHCLLLSRKNQQRTEDKHEKNTTGSPANLPDKEILTNSPQGYLKGTEKNITFLPHGFLLKFCSCALLILLL